MMSALVWNSGICLMYHPRDEQHAVALHFLVPLCYALTVYHVSE